jgi:hypothetical protein
MSNPLSMLPPKARAVVYLIVGFGGLIIGSLDVFYGDSDPEWLNGLVRVAAWLSGALGLTAATHVPKTDEDKVVQVPVLPDATPDGADHTRSVSGNTLDGQAWFDDRGVLHVVRDGVEYVNPFWGTHK